MPTRLRNIAATVIATASFAACAEHPQIHQSSTASAPGVAVSAPNNAAADRVREVVERTVKQLVFLEGGTFEMGDWSGPSGLPYDSDRDSKPLHKVTLDSFSMMAYQVPYEDFDVFTNAERAEHINTDPIINNDRRPRLHASPNWYGAKAYCQWLRKQSGLSFDLPTEAQWEYGARARGQKLIFATDTGMIERGRNFPNKKPWNPGTLDQSDLPPEVGSYPSNPVGLYGMSEGAKEWINDWYDPDYYKKSPLHNPQGPGTGTLRVQRGSSGVPVEAANMVFMRVKATPRTVEQRFTGNPNDDVAIPGFSSLAGNAVRCVVNSSSRIK